MSREDKARRARDILNDVDEKQRICNELIGTKFKDIEKTLQDIVDSKKFSSREQDEESEIMEYAPEKLTGPIKPTMAKSPGKLEYILDKDEVNYLVNASSGVLATETVESPNLWYNSYSSEETLALEAGTYDPSHFERRRA